MVTLFIILGVAALLAPLIGARIIGLIWGGLLKLGIVGRILTTLITALPFVFIVISMVKSASSDPYDFTGAILATAVFGLALLLPIWYFFWHYHAIEDMGAIVFSSILKNFILIILLGTIVGLIVAMFKESAGYTVIGASVIGAAVFYFFATREYSCPDYDEIKIRWISILAAVGVIAVFGFFAVMGIDKDAEAQRKAAIFKIGQSAVVTGDEIRLYSEPDLNSEIMKTLTTGNEVLISGKEIKDKKYKRQILIQVEHEGTKGYVMKNRLRKIE